MVLGPPATMETDPVHARLELHKCSESWHSVVSMQAQEGGKKQDLEVRVGPIPAPN